VCAAAATRAAIYAEQRLTAKVSIDHAADGADALRLLIKQEKATQKKSESLVT
jgi:hypothetical protein